MAGLNVSTEKKKPLVRSNEQNVSCYLKKTQEFHLGLHDHRTHRAFSLPADIINGVQRRQRDRQWDVVTLSIMCWHPVCEKTNWVM